MESPLWYETRLGRFLGWIDDHTPGMFPWARIWLWPKRGPLRCRFSLHFFSGNGGLMVGFPLPRWLPGFVKRYQIDGPRSAWILQTCPWWRESDLTVIIPVLPPGKPHAGRARRLRRKK